VRVLGRLLRGRVRGHVGPADGTDWYLVSTKKPRAWLRRPKRSVRPSWRPSMTRTSPVRQMFYMLTVREAVEKEESGYRKAQRQLLALRREGVVPYNWIADNTRWMRKPTTYAGLGDFFDRAAGVLPSDLWVRSVVYVEGWCEKDALAAVLMPITREYEVPLMVARGYSAETFAYNAAEAMRETGKPCYVYYVGDFDPSAWQMARSLEQKLAEFGAPGGSSACGESRSDPGVVADTAEHIETACIEFRIAQGVNACRRLRCSDAQHCESAASGMHLFMALLGCCISLLDDSDYSSAPSS
jgi:hypothetical protein